MAYNSSESRLSSPSSSSAKSCHSRSVLVRGGIRDTLAQLRQTLIPWSSRTSCSLSAAQLAHLKVLYFGEVIVHFSTPPA